MSSPSAAPKVNYLVIRYLHFRSVEGDLQEGSCYASRCQLPLLPSTKSRFLCFFGLRNPRFQAFRAHNLHFCARGGSRSDVADNTGAMLTLGDAAAAALKRWDDSRWAQAAADVGGVRELWAQKRG